jgi:hypothetical protein
MAAGAPARPIAESILTESLPRPQEDRLQQRTRYTIQFANPPPAGL